MIEMSILSNILGRRANKLIYKKHCSMCSRIEVVLLSKFGLQAIPEGYTDCPGIQAASLEHHHDPEPPDCPLSHILNIYEVLFLSISRIFKIYHFFISSLHEHDACPDWIMLRLEI